MNPLLRLLGATLHLLFRSDSGRGERSWPSLRQATWTFVGLAGFCGSLTVLYLSMRAVLDVGGFCAQGGPYEIRVECPEGVAWMTPVSIFAGLFFVGLYIGFRPDGGPSLASLAWPALFLSLGWNFLEYGINPPSGGSVAIGWLIPAAFFLAMGGVPLLIILRAGIRPLLWGQTAPPGAPGGTTAAWDSGGLARAFRRRVPLVAGLERLSRLRRQELLTDAEYRAAKETLLREEEKEP